MTTNSIELTKNIFSQIEEVLKEVQQTLEIEVRDRMTILKNEEIPTKISKIETDINYFKNMYSSCKQIMDKQTNTMKLINELQTKATTVFTQLEEKGNLIKKKIKQFDDEKNEMLSKEDEKWKQIKNFIQYDELKQLEEWTGLQCSDIVFDSDKDNWKEKTSVFDERIIGKKQLVFLIEDTDGEKFGYYLNTEVIEDYEYVIRTDNKSFHFNLESHGRLPHPMKFEIKDLKEGGYMLWGKSDSLLIYLGDIVLYKENQKNESNCEQNEEDFDYHGIKKAL